MLAAAGVIARSLEDWRLTADEQLDDIRQAQCSILIRLTAADRVAAHAFEHGLFLHRRPSEPFLVGAEREDGLFRLPCSPVLEGDGSDLEQLQACARGVRNLCGGSGLHFRSLRALAFIFLATADCHGPHRRAVRTVPPL